MKVVAIIQARLGSTRLPGKTLRELAGATVLARVVSRVRRFRQVDHVLVATTACVEDSRIIEECDRIGVASFRGDEGDVLDRYYRAAQETGAEAVVRITSDCPLIDPGVSDYTIQRFLDERPDYASNTLERSYPRGLDTEVISFSALETAWGEARESYQRAHVTPYLYQHPKGFRLLSVKSPTDYSGHRWTLDTPEDLEFLQAVYARTHGADDFGWLDVLQILEREPALIQLNAHVAQKALHEG